MVQAITDMVLTPRADLHPAEVLEEEVLHLPLEVMVHNGHTPKVVII